MDPIDSSLYYTNPYLENVDTDSEKEKVIGFGILDSEKYEYLFRQKNNKWTVKLTKVKVKHHSPKGRCECDYDLAESFLVNDTIYSGAYEIK